MQTKTDALGNLIISEPLAARPNVLVFNTNADELDKWVLAIQGRCTVRTAASLDELQEVLAVGKIDVVVAEWKDGILDRLQGMKQGRLIHCGAVLHDAVIEATELNIRFSHVHDPAELTSKIFALTFPRSESARHNVKGLKIWPALDHAYDLIDVSNDGFCFRVDANQSLDPVLPGTVFQSFIVSKGDTTALIGSSAIVRHLGVEERKGPPYYLVGCEMRRVPSDQAVGQLTFIRDRALCAGLVRTALRGEGISLQSVDGSQIGVHCTSGQVNPLQNELSLPSTPHDFTEYEVVRGRFELRGSVYRFSTAVKSRRPLAIRLPATLEVAQLRGSGRYRPPATEPVVVTMTAPLLAEPIEREVRDISSTGFALDIDPLLDLFPPGMELSLVEIKIAGRTFASAGRVKNLSRLSGREDGLRCGIEFIGLDDSTRLKLADVIMRCRYPGLEDGGVVSFPKMWAFFLETGFVYPKKQALLEPQLEQIEQTMAALNSRANKVFKSVVAKKDDKLIGHVSGVRGYRRTLVSQHLTAATGYNIGSILNLGLLEYIDQNPDIDYFKSYFQPTNKYPARIFGGFARNISDPYLSDLRTFGYLSLPPDFAVPSPSDVTVTEAGADDLRTIERYFVGVERGLILRSDDLTCEGLRLTELNQSFKQLGLRRERKVLMASAKDKPVAFALVELSSPGLNFSELLSGFRTFTLPGGESFARESAAALINASVRVYRGAGRPQAITLISAENTATYASLGIETTKQYSVWTCQRALYQRFNDYVDRLVKTLLARTGRQPNAAQPK